MDKLFSGSTNVSLKISLIVDDIPTGYEDQLADATYRVEYYTDDDPTIKYWDGELAAGTQLVYVRFTNGEPVPQAGRYIVWVRIIFSDLTYIYSTPNELRIWRPGEVL
jgi:hypothetical protein